MDWEFSPSRHCPHKKRLDGPPFAATVGQCHEPPGQLVHWLLPLMSFLQSLGHSPNLYLPGRFEGDGLDQAEMIFEFTGKALRIS